MYSKLNFKELFSQSGDSKLIYTNYTLGTVHSIKGETFEAILFFVKKKGGDNRNYNTILNSQIIENEELRIVYVAISRPRKILVIACPEKDVSVWATRFS